MNRKPSVSKLVKNASKTAIVKKASPLDKDYLKGLDHSLDEWHSDEDEKAYKNL